MCTLTMWLCCRYIFELFMYLYGVLSFAWLTVNIYIMMLPVIGLTRNLFVMHAPISVKQRAHILHPNAQSFHILGSFTRCLYIVTACSFNKLFHAMKYNRWKRKIVLCLLFFHLYVSICLSNLYRDSQIYYWFMANSQ